MEQGTRLTTGAEFADRDAKPTPEQFNRLMPAARELFPLGEPVETQPWLGSRPCFADSRPVIGRAPGQPGLWLDYGHAHWGLTLGPASGRLIAEMMTGATPFCDPEPYSSRAVQVLAKLVAPAWLCSWESQRARLIHAAGNSARHHIGSQRAQLRQRDHRVGERSRAGRRCEHQVAIERRMDRPQCPRHAVLRHHGEPARLRLGQGPVGRDHDQRRVFAGLAFSPEGEGALRNGGGEAASTEFLVALVGRSPEMRPAADHRGADGVDHGQRADGSAVRGLC